MRVPVKKYRGGADCLRVNSLRGDEGREAGTPRKGDCFLDFEGKCWGERRGRETGSSWK